LIFQANFASDNSENVEPLPAHIRISLYVVASLTKAVLCSAKYLGTMGSVVPFFFKMMLMGHR